jgi:hypothetical protein
LLADAWYVTESREEVMRRLSILKARVRSFGVDPLREPAARMAMLALDGSLDAAITLALDEILPQP